MKRLIIICLTVCMLLSLCACNLPFLTPKPEAPVVEPQKFDLRPSPDTLQVTVDGKALGAVYKKYGVFFVCFDELLEILDGTLVTDVVEKEPYTATITLGKTTYTISNEETTLNEGEAAHPLVYEPIYDGEKWYVPMEPIMSLLGLHLLEDTTSDTRYYTFLPDISNLPEGKNVPTLMYHAVGDNLWGIPELFVSPAELEKQFQYLKDNGYTPITYEDFDRLDSIEKPVMLTFDDGYDNNYTELFPLLKKFNFKATVFVITGEIGKTNYMKKEQIKEMSASGLVSIQSHTLTHPKLGEIGTDQLDKELRLSKLALARITGKEPFVLCYPVGSYSGTSIEYTQKYYSFGILMNGGMYTTGTHDLYHIPRFYVSRNTDIYTFAAYLQ